MNCECVTDELREYVAVLYRLGEIPEWLRDRFVEIAGRIDIRADDEIAYSLAQAENDREESLEEALAYAHDTGFDEGYEEFCRKKDNEAAGQPSLF